MRRAHTNRCPKCASQKVAGKNAVYGPVKGVPQKNAGSATSIWAFVLLPPLRSSALGSPAGHALRLGRCCREDGAEATSAALSSPAPPAAVFVWSRGRCHRGLLPSTRCPGRLLPSTRCPRGLLPSTRCIEVPALSHCLRCAQRNARPWFFFERKAVCTE